jgi:hypothetical protein
MNSFSKIQSTGQTASVRLSHPDLHNAFNEVMIAEITNWENAKMCASSSSLAKGNHFAPGQTSTG